MGRTPCCSKVGLHRGPWTAKEDTLLENYIQTHGEGHWKSLPEKAGLLRCGKSCRLRWMNYLRPDIRRGNITPDEDDLIIRLHSLLGNRWSLIAGRLPGRTDNEIKNYWNSHLSKRLKNKGNYKQDGDGKTITKTKVYQPKAVRIPFSSPFYAHGNNFGEAKLACDHKDSDFVYDYDCHPCHNSEPTTDDMLDKIYKEYQQLLTEENQPSLVSFVDSLFI